MAFAAWMIDKAAGDPRVTEVAHALIAGERASIGGACGSSVTVLAGAISRLGERPVLLVQAHLDEADEAVDELLSMGVHAGVLPAMESSQTDRGVRGDALAERLSALNRLGAESGKDGVIVAAVASLMQPLPAEQDIARLTRRLDAGAACDPAELASWLVAAGYTRLDSIEEAGDFAVRGGIMDVFPPGGAPARLDFFGDEIERIAEIDLATMASDRKLDALDLVSVEIDAKTFESATGCLDRLSPDTLVLLHEPMEVTEQARGYYERVVEGGMVIPPPKVLAALQEQFAGYAEVGRIAPAALARERVIELPTGPLPQFAEDATAAFTELSEQLAVGDGRAIVLCEQEGDLQRCEELIAELPESSRYRVEARSGYLHRGFVWAEPGDGLGLLLIPYHELVHRVTVRRRARKVRSGRAMDTFLDIAPGDIVVHRDHGLAKFVELTRMPARSIKGRSKRSGRKNEATEEYLTLEFARGAKLHVPATQIDLVSKYVGGFRGKPKLSTLGGKGWSAQKDRVSEAVRDLAAELLRVRAARESMPGVRYPGDTTWQGEFEGSFPWALTDDQAAAIMEIKRDMAGARPMDRLLCGDVGYGKTELAIRAAFKAAEFGKQVAVLVPTTVLAEQHERTFRSRMAGYPFRIESLSRFKTGSEINRALAALRKGQVDIVIGTHRLLSKDVKFADLGLVIVDEEQRFGVEHKERLLALRATVDVLTMSATPIPRTLHMSMLGLRDISSLSTPPVDRRAVVTEVIPYNEVRLRRAIERELAREGQVFYVHNRVHSIMDAVERVQRMAPDARVIFGHGQMPAGELEQVMLKFVQGEADVLVSTTIIESGIDIPTANTMVIEDADRFGLAELHQLRGRVGRYKHRAYCYMLLPNKRTVQEKAKKRLRAIEEFSMLGAGFKIAMRDLEIRGAGNILGPEQSGHIAAVGYDMYCRLLDQEVRDLKGERLGTPSETALELGVSGSIPKGYIPSDQRRLEAYRRIAVATSLEELAAARKDVVGAYGQLPSGVERLLDLAALRVVARALGVRACTVRAPDVVFRVEPDMATTLAACLEGDGLRVTSLPPKPGESLAEVYLRPPESYLEPATLLPVLLRRLTPEQALPAAAG